MLEASLYIQVVCHWRRNEIIFGQEHWGAICALPEFQHGREDNSTNEKRKNIHSYMYKIEIIFFCHIKI